MSLSSLLSIARTALLTQQKAVDTTGHNIANAGTEGYSRQRLILEPAVPLQRPFGQVGRGVTVAGIERFRSRFLDAGFRRENGELGRFQTTRDLLGRVEGVFGEPGGTGLAAGLDALWGAFGDLANDPAGQTPRTLARQAAENIVSQFRDADRRLGDLQAETRMRLEGRVQEANELARQIAELNVRVQAGSAGQREAPDVKDQRDRLIDRLSSLVGVRVLDRDDGTVGVIAGDTLLVDGAQHATLEVRDLGRGASGVGVSGVAAPMMPQSGEVAALVELSGRTIPGFRARLDALARGLVTEVNTLHRAGRNLTGATGLDFFDPTGLTAAGMAVSTEVRISTDNIAAGRSGAPGDNANALAIAALRTTGVAAFGGETAGQAYQRLVAEVGVATMQADQRATAQEVVAAQADTLRQSLSGVSVDEELTQLIAQQNAFAAAARLVSVADEMMQSVIGMVR